MADVSHKSGMEIGEPDVFETSDLPEADQPVISADFGSESVEPVDVNVAEAFKRFNTKSVSAADIDFSDRIGPCRRTGYYVPATGDYELLGENERSRETPEHKYQRLQREIKELADDINLIKETVKADVQTVGPSPVALAAHVEYLEKQLRDLSLEKLIGGERGGPGGESTSASDPHEALRKRLMTELDAFKTREAKAKVQGTDGKSDADAQLADGDHMTFKLFYQPQQAKFSNVARMAELEQRLEHLESVLGQNLEQFTPLSSDVENKNILGVLTSLTSKVKLLDPVQLNQVESRLSTISHRLSQLSENAGKIEQSQKLSKVSELHDLMKKWEPTAVSLPSIVERLTLLKDLHEQALQFTQTMKRLDASQQQINDQLKAHSSELKQVMSTMSENQTVIVSNCNSLATRLTAINK